MRKGQSDMVHHGALKTSKQSQVRSVSRLNRVLYVYTGANKYCDTGTVHTTLFCS